MEKEAGMDNAGTAPSLSPSIAFLPGLDPSDCFDAYSPFQPQSRALHQALSHQYFPPQRREPPTAAKAASGSRPHTARGRPRVAPPFGSQTKRRSYFDQPARANVWGDHVLHPISPEGKQAIARRAPVAPKAWARQVKTIQKVFSPTSASPPASSSPSPQRPYGNEESAMEPTTTTTTTATTMDSSATAPAAPSPDSTHSIPMLHVSAQTADSNVRNGGKSTNASAASAAAAASRQRKIAQSAVSPRGFVRSGWDRMEAVKRLGLKEGGPGKGIIPVQPRKAPDLSIFKAPPVKGTVFSSCIYEGFHLFLISPSPPSPSLCSWQVPEPKGNGEPMPFDGDSVIWRSPHGRPK